MKTASKLLSMLLLVAMCLSLMGGSAYATGLAPIGDTATLGLAPLGTDDSSTVGGSTGSDSSTVSSSTFDLKPLSDDADSSTTFDLDKPSALTAEKNIWNGEYAELETAAQKTTDIKLHDDAVDPKDPGGTISRSVVIDLNKKTLEFTGILTVNANITIKNGALKDASKITVGKGFKVTFVDVNLNGTTVSNGEAEVAEKYIATIGIEKFATMDEAYAYAAMQGGTVTINVVDDSSKLENYDIGSMPATMSCSAIVLNLGKNCLEGTLLSSVSLTINGGTIEGSIIPSGDLTLNSTEVTGDVVVTGTKLFIYSSDVNQVSLLGGELTMGSGSSIGTLGVYDDDGGLSKLYVSGGLVKRFVLASEDENPSFRAITGGEWNVSVGGDGAEDTRSLNYLRNCVADGLTLKGTKNPYTVGEGAGSGSGGTDNGFTYSLYGSPYTKNSTGTVYVDISALSTNGYWIGTKADATDAQRIDSTSYEGPVANGTGYRLTFKNSYLNSLPNGTYYLFAVYGGNTVRMCSTTNPLVITGSGSITINPGDAAVWPVDSAWYSGSGMYYFYVTPALQLVDGTPYDYYDVAIDGVQVGGDKLSYNGYQKFGVASSVMDSLSIGTHTITVLTTAGYASCNFRVGATLRPVDTDKHVTGSSKNLQFVCSDSISRVWVGPTELTSLNYGDYWTLSSSGKTITLTAKFLNNLSAGSTRTLTVLTANGDQPSCTFQILTTAQASSSPRTGDESNLALWAAVLLLSGGAAVAILPRLKKHED